MKNVLLRMKLRIKMLVLKWIKFATVLILNP